MQTIETDRVIIIGAGLGGLYAALSLAPRPVVMISPETLGEGASSAWAQGGVAAAMNSPDTPQSHAEDTVRAGAGIVIREIAEFVTREAKAHILDLARLGTPFDRTKDGEYVLSREAAHSFARVVRVKGDQAGAQIMKALVQQVRETPSIQLLEGTMAMSLEVSGGRVLGVEIEKSDQERSAPVLLRGPAILLAGGGSGGLYMQTTNPPRIRGQVIGMAARAGAIISDPEFVQFHPTAMDFGEDPAPLATEALRGDGAILINNSGRRFMQDIHPDAELAPRDIVARAIFKEHQAGRRPMLDTQDAIGDEVIEKYLVLADACQRNGIDPRKEPVPVAPAAHYHMGGVSVNKNGKSSLDALWVCGEASSTGLHGANRLASNGLLEALVYARICAEGIINEVALGDKIAPIEPNFVKGDTPPDPEAVLKLRQVMSADVGVVRNANGLKRALRVIADLEMMYGQNIAFANMLAPATLITAGALLREESRGAHMREDFPETQGEIGMRTMITFDEAKALRDKICEEA